MQRQISDDDEYCIRIHLVPLLLFLISCEYTVIVTNKTSSHGSLAGRFIKLLYCDDDYNNNNYNDNNKNNHLNLNMTHFQNLWLMRFWY